MIKLEKIEQDISIMETQVGHPVNNTLEIKRCSFVKHVVK